jgi:hypothetical protein
MKRVRSEQEEEDEDKKIDWQRLFHMECILSVLHPYLSTADLIHLSCVNKCMNTTWINNERRLSVLGMRDRVLLATGRKYNVRNPLLFLKKALYKACAAPEKDAKRFKCWECKRPKLMKWLAIDRERWPASTCIECAKESMDKHYFNLPYSDSIYYCILYSTRLWYTSKVRAIFDEWYEKEKDAIISVLKAQRFTFWLTQTETRSYVHKSFFKSFIESVNKIKTIQ